MVPIWAGYTTAWVTTLFGAEVSSGDPLSLFTSLGIGGLIAGVTYMWQRDTAKTRDKALDIAAALTVELREVRIAVDKGADAHREGTLATRQMLAVLEGLPPRETWVRVLDALQERDRRR